jgi:TrmH family RNA methyltransferase
MISRQQLKFIKSLQLKKYQKQEQKFLVEGEKSVLELLHSRYKINILLATKRFLNAYPLQFSQKCSEIIQVSEDDLARAGAMKTNNAAIAVVDMPDSGSVDISRISLLPVFERLKDPGNLGSILRTCDWYGIDQIVLSEDSVDQYNPKVIQASMGSFTRVRVSYIDLQGFLETLKDIPVFGTSTTGESIYSISFPRRAVVLFGNESQGLSKSLDAMIDRAISIPRFGEAESLNVGIAAAVIFDNFRRQNI